ncbi:MAG: hypothetical protein HOW73_46025 [Polyangiaceae bacterium]|nr:hypothetical protein [Polyangiaceae bacterium]
MARGGLILACATFVAWTSACDETTSDPSVLWRPAGPVPSLSAPIRPLDRYVMAKRDERCVVEVLRDDVVVETLEPDYACPRDLEMGERIRLTGMVCMREGGESAERNVPVVCPNPLTNAERDRRKAAAPKDGG